MKLDLTDQVALVTGSAHRVGKAIALELARNGVNIMVHYHNSSPDAVRESVHEIKSLGVDAFSIQADLSQPEGVQQVIDALEDNYDRLDILVNSASTFQRRTLLETSFDDWEETFAVNLRAPFLFTQAVAPIMQRNPKGGCIVNICDRGVDGPWPEFAHHGVSKAALWSLTQVTAVSLGPGIRANAIVPGPILPPAGSNMSEDDWQKLGSNNPLETPGNPADVGRAVVYLAGEDFLTGTLIHVNAGEHLN